MPELQPSAAGNGDCAWPMAAARVWPGLTVLRAPLNPAYDLDGGPQVPAADAAGCVARLIDAARARPDAPGVIAAGAVVAEGPAWDALQTLDAAGRIRMTIISEWRRAMLERSAAADAEAYFAAFLSAATRKGLRRKRRALAEGGTLAFSVGVAPDAVMGGFAAFCDLEARGWKGRAGTALERDSEGRAYVASVLTAGAARGAAFTAVLSQGGRPVAAGLLLRSGGDVSFWKTAYDETLAKQSPGVILDVMLTEWLYAQLWFARLDAGHDDSVDPDTLIWKQRRRMADVVIDLAPGSWRGRAVVAGLRLRRRLRAWRNRRQAAK